MALSAIHNGHYAEGWLGTFQDEATDTIALLTARAAFGQEGRGGRLVSTRHWRIDRQKNIAGVGGGPGKSNLQLQKNDVDRPSTVACLIVPDQYLFSIDGPGADNREAELTRVIRNGLVASWKSWVGTTQAGSWAKRGATVQVFEITGEFSSPRPQFVSPQKPVR